MTVPSSSPPLDYAPFNRPDGHSPTAPLLVHLGVDVDDTQLVGQHDTAQSLVADAPIAVFDMETGDRVPLLTEMDQTLRDARYDGRHLLIIRPMAPMQMGHRHVAVMTTALRDADGNAIEVPRGFAALRDGTPTNHAALEAARPAYDEIFNFLGSNGYARDQLVLAWDFEVASQDWVLGGILSMRDQALSAVDSLHYTIDNVQESPNANVLRIVEGTFEAPTFLDDNNEIQRTDTGGATLQPTMQTFPFTMIVPARASSGEALPLVMFGHGVFGSGRDYLEGSIGTDSIQPLAQNAGAVVVATDWIGLSSADRDLVVNQLANDINQVNVITDRLQQALINNLVLTELVRNQIALDPQVTGNSAGDTTILTDDVFYYGVSLGGIQGSSFVSLSSRITRAILAVPGGAWATLLTRSVVYEPVRALIDIKYPDPLLQQTFIAMVQARFDGSDGANVGQLLVRRPLPDAPSERHVLIQEAIGDCQVPNVATGILARAMGFELIQPAVEPVFGLDQVTAPTTDISMIQIQMPDRLAEYTPPDSNLLPDHDNGVHSNAIGLPQALDQVSTLLTTGTIEDPCTGSCNPD